MIWGNGSLAIIFSPFVKPVNTTKQLLTNGYHEFIGRGTVIVFVKKKCILYICNKMRTYSGGRVI
jgi:hypothetical protein